MVKSAFLSIYMFERLWLDFLKVCLCVSGMLQPLYNPHLRMFIRIEGMEKDFKVICCSRLSHPLLVFIKIHLKLSTHLNQGEQNKILAVYLTLTNILPHNRSTINHMQLVLLCREQNFKCFGIDKVSVPPYQGSEILGRDGASL